MLTLEPRSVRCVAVVLLGGGLGVLLVHVACLHAALLQSKLSAYEQRLTAELRFLRMAMKARVVVLAQGVGLVLTLACLHVGAWLPASVLVALVAAPQPWLHGRRARRVTAIEAQLDGWLLGLSSSLRATPALGEALAFSKSLTGAPLCEEIELLLKEQQVGVPLDDGLTNMATRVDSRTLQSALAAVRIGRNSGGDLSTILERSAAALREMGRLEGVVRTKTAEGKAQAYVVAVLPLPLVGLISYLNPVMLKPLVSSESGLLVCAIALSLWLSSIVVARKILDVDI